MKIKKVLVTGASGFFGSHICEALHHAGYEVHALVRETSSRRWLAHDWLSVHTADLFDSKALVKILQPIEVVVHNAGALWGDYQKVNTQGTRMIAEASIEAGVEKFIYISSLAAGGPSQGLCARDASLPDNPVSQYGHSKKAAESFLQNIRDRKNVVIFRFPMIYGPRDTQGLRLFKTFKILINPSVGFRRRHLSVIHVRDAAGAVVAALQTAVESGAIYPISDGEDYTFNKLYKIIGKVWGRKALRIPVPFAFIMLGAWFVNDVLNGKTAFNPEQIDMFRERYWLIAPDKAVRELGWRAEVDIYSGIKETIEWYEKNGWL